MNHSPPKWADRFLKWYCRPDLIEDLQGDLYELHEARCANGKIKSANYIFIWYVLKSFRYATINKKFIPKHSAFTMTTNNFKIAFRVLKRDKFNTGINLLGLTIGIACFMLLGLYFTQEFSYDKFHTKKDRIYRSWLKEDYGDGKVFFNSNTPLRFEALFEEHFPEVEAAVQFIPENHLVGNGENRISEQIAVISPEFFEIFDFEIIAGNSSTPLPTKNDLVISKAYAKKYFGDKNPVGLTLGIQINEGIRDFTVSAIMEDIQKTSSIKFDMAISNQNNKELYGESNMSAWFTIIPDTYLLLKENTSINAMENKIQGVVMSYLKDEVDEGVYQIGFQPLTDIHLNPDIPLGYAPVANPQYVYILGLIGVLVLIIACINYTTLSVGQSLKRAKEVGMRKVLGAIKSTLIYQYLSESILLALIAMTLGTAITLLVIPLFNILTGAEITYIFELWHMWMFLAIGLIIGITAGVYPSLVLSNFRIINALRGKLSSSGNHVVRKTMVVFQFLVTVFLISSTLIMRDQLNFLQGKYLGYNYETVITVPLHASPDANGLTQQVGTGMANGEILKQKLSLHPEVSKITMATHTFGTPGWANLAFTDKEGAFRRFQFLTVDPNFISAFSINILSGRDFDKENASDKRQSILINQAAVDYFGLKDPIGEKLPGNDFGEHQIIGVTDNFHYASLHDKVQPLVITQNISPIVQGVSDGNITDSVIPKLMFTYTGPQLVKVEKILKEAWESSFPNENLEFNFLDEKLKLQYVEEARMNKLITISTVLSIIIASLGLLGLTVLVVNSRIKEIGIRKVMGASPITIFKLLVNSFSSQLLIAIILSIPLTYWLMNQWLTNFEYRIEIGLELFVLSGILSIAIALIVISFHTIKAAMVNPIESLRTE
jgi:putative ABC transport system permease protein